jgi:hypothetical protein
MVLWGDCLPMGSTNEVSRSRKQFFSACFFFYVDFGWNGYPSLTEA